MANLMLFLLISTSQFLYATSNKTPEVYIQLAMFLISELHKIFRADAKVVFISLMLSIWEASIARRIHHIYKCYLP